MLPIARPLRIQFKDAWYHVMNRGAGRRAVFLNDSHRRYFLFLLDEISQVYGIEVHVYCLMGNHYHLVIHTPHGNLSEAMRHLNSRYTRYFNRTMKKDGALFRGRYKAIVVSAEEYLLRLSRYIHLNPLKAKLVTDLQQYRWSSFRSYIGRRQTLQTLKTDEVLKRFKQRKFKGSYKKFVETGNDAELDEFYSKTQFKPVLGEENYCEAIFEHLKKQSLSSEIVGADNIIVAPTLKTILKAVADHFGVDTKQIFRCDKRVKNKERRVAILLCREIGGITLEEIGQVMGNVTYTTISKTVSRAKADKAITKDIRKIKSKLEKSTSRMKSIV